ncbi:transglycosylase domain-containing protein [Luteimicrobium subarcticum]|uniref:Membrane peptidoglycan carboxypeptidase n=1 Tax=Luteimicrobium subarcticum TaxID=620910 RepID=A0A2M8WJJ1_9MICO|nr:transglycosylase domain-containing protein [Luteimicrobium subarcticum]PJI91095.1 membrane peptidoglycan carboxypeptidase [Luteimicrobium subarcticum]
MADDDALATGDASADEADGELAGEDGARTPYVRTGWRRFFNYPRSHVTSFRRWLPSWRVVIGSILGCFALGAGVLVAAYATTTVPTEPAALTQWQTTTVFYSDGKTVIGTLRDDNAQNRKIIDTSKLPSYVRDAVVASEDRSFYENSGVDLKGMARAALTNLKYGTHQGGSTITQQTAERYYTSGTTSDYVGKLKEAMLAVKMSKSQDKDKILENYLNTIYFGRGANGIEAAANAYFGISAAKLSPSQSALLAGLIPGPGIYDPRVNPDLSEGRWSRCLGFMKDDGYITQKQYDDAMKKGMPVTKKVKTSQQNAGQNGYILQMVRDEIEKQTGMTDEQVNQRGMNIVTTIDKSMEADAVKSVAETPKDANPRMGTGLVTLDPKTGEIKALYGGPDYLKNQRNAVTKASAQAGSTFKAFTLAAGLRAGDSLDQIYDGSDQRVVPGWDKPVSNFEGESEARVTLKRAFALSINTVFAQVNDQVGPSATAAMAKRLGITTEVQTNAANVLGTASVHPLDLANAYATFANEGIKTTPHIIKTAKELDGDLVYKGSTKGTRVIDAEIASGVTEAAQDVVHEGSGMTAQGLGRPVAGKTGSSNLNHSAWFVGYTPQLVTAVGLWQSGKDGSEQTIAGFGGWNYITGSTWPTTLWTNYMKRAMDGMDVEDFPEYQPTMATWTPTPTWTQTQQPTQEPTQASTPTDEPTQQDDGTAQIPDVSGQSEAAARQLLQNAGFQVTTRQVPSDKVAQGVVLSTLPGGGVTAKRGSAVILLVSSGPPVVVPTQAPTPTSKPTSKPTTTSEPTSTPTQGGGDDGGGGGGNGGGGNGGGGNGGGQAGNG